jgi:endonuclease/exonuclease/phosphatase family metal-dependent hydrolase
VRIATWNVRHGRPRHGFTSTRGLASAVAALDVDVLAVQEVDRWVIRSWFADESRLIGRAAGADRVEFAPARRFLLLTGQDGIALALRGELEHSRRLMLPRDNASQNRVAIIAHLVVGEVRLTVVTTHLHNDAPVARRQLDALLDDTADEPRPFVLLGDLNLRPDDFDTRLAAAGLVLVDAPFTEPAWDPVQRIDHVVIDGLVPDNVSVPVVAVSDHRPVVVDLRPAP